MQLYKFWLRVQIFCLRVWLRKTQLSNIFFHAAYFLKDIIYIHQRVEEDKKSAQV